MRITCREDMEVGGQNIASPQCINKFLETAALSKTIYQVLKKMFRSTFHYNADEKNVVLLYVISLKISVSKIL